MKFDEYQKWTKTTAIYPVEHALSYLSLGLTGEAGEVANKVKKVFRDSRVYTTNNEIDLIVDELGDILWYIAQLSNYLEVDFSRVVKVNKEKLNNRKLLGILKRR